MPTLSPCLIEGDPDPLLAGRTHESRLEIPVVVQLNAKYWPTGEDEEASVSPKEDSIDFRTAITLYYSAEGHAFDLEIRQEGYPLDPYSPSLKWPYYIDGQLQALTENGNDFQKAWAEMSD